LQQFQLAYISRGTLNKNHNMSVNNNQAASQLNMKKLSISKIFSFLAAGVVATVREFSQNFENARIGYSRARKKP
jgi:hypothetical protein